MDLSRRLISSACALLLSASVAAAQNTASTREARQRRAADPARCLRAPGRRGHREPGAGQVRGRRRDGLSGRGDGRPVGVTPHAGIPPATALPVSVPKN